MTVTNRRGSAGSGVDYLERTVISGDQAIKGRDLNDYWSTGGDTPGQWLGAQAAAMGLAGQQVTKDAADAIYKHGVDPTTGAKLGTAWYKYATPEERLEQLLAAEPDATEARKAELHKQAERAGNQTARSFWEQVYSPVKSWSVLWAVSDDKTRAQLEEVEREAFEKVFARIEQEACWTRIGPDGGAQVKGRGLIAASYIHRTSRAGDPDWHRHLAISAKVRSADGRWLALDGRPLQRMTVAFSEMYTTELERGMAKRFGILAAPREDTIRSGKRPVREYMGVSVSMVRLFSQRRQQTEKALQQLTGEFIEREGRKPTKVEGYALAQAAALVGRPDKKPKSIGAERRKWRRQAWGAGMHRPGRWLQYAQQATREYLQDAEERAPLEDVAGRVLEVLEGHRDSWTRTNAEAETIRQLTASGWHIKAGDGFDFLVNSVTDHVLNPERCELITPPEIVTAPSAYRRADGSSIFVQVGAERYTSHRIKGWESDLVEAGSRPTTVTILTPDQVDQALNAGDAERGFVPTDEQRAAVQGVFGRDQRLTGIIGPAGTGKTTIMKLVKEVADAHGIQILGLANGQMQADGLAAAAGIRAENIARWRVMSGQFAAGSERWTLRPETIVIVDEAGQASTPDLHNLLQQVEDAGGRLLPTGDPRQLGSPGVGGALDLIERAGACIHLSEVRRFRSVGGQLRHWEIDAAKALAYGDAEASWEAYNSHDRIHTGSLDEMLQAAYAAWQRDTADGLTSILIAPTNALAAQLSTWARADRVAAGEVDDRRTVTLENGTTAGVGDQIVTRVNNRQIVCEDTRQYVRNGDVWTVQRIERGALLVEHAQTGNRAWLPADYVAGGGVELGYAITKDRAQGVTVHTGHGIWTAGMDSNAAYPEMTRGTYTNHAYLATEDQLDPETGQPAAPMTGRQLWASIVARDGTQLSATARQRALWDEAEAIRTHLPALRYVLDDLADSIAQDAILQLLPDVGDAIVTAPAWPALRDQLKRFAAEGIDTDALVVAASESREWTGDIDDYASILHARNRTIMERGGAQRFTRTADSDEPKTAPTFEGDPQAVGDDVLAALGLRMPAAEGLAQDDPRHAFAWALASAIQNRATHLADSAKAAAAAGEGWAVAYGPEPEDLAAAVAWHDRIQAAAAFRDLADYTGADATGPAPTTDEPLQRGLWRAAQPTTDDDQVAANVTAAARSGASWMDSIGTPPPVGDPTRRAWIEAAAAVQNYRELWEFGSESAAIGNRPTDPVQAVDHDTAREAIAAYRLVQRYPNLAEADADTLGRLIARGDAGARAASEAAAALAEYHRADLARTAAVQAAEDAANRAAAAQESDAEAEPADRNPGRLAALQRAASRAAVEALTAQRAADSARSEVERTAPGAVKAREDARRAEDARRLLARRAVRGEDHPDAPPQPDNDPAGPRWTDRAHGELTDAELVSIAARAVEAAVQIDEEHQAAAAARGTKPVPSRTADELRDHAAALRAESRTRAVMAPDQRAQEADERAARRSSSADERLRRAYEGQPAEQDRRRRTEGPAVARPEQADRPRRRTEAPKPSGSRAEERLSRAYEDRTSPEQLQHAKRSKAQEKPAQSKRPQPSEKAPKQEPTTPTRPPKPKPKNRANARLEAAYDRDTDPRTGKRADGPDRGKRKPPPPPRRPGGPAI
ncbi:MobF family relaxase [Streptomyces kronopolitis]|uniref:MobF family relaxase n=1 Tax=Streptomyces kronopolitis TaxID=1612435 RepID=UPI003D975F8D